MDSTLLAALVAAATGAIAAWLLDLRREHTGYSRSQLEARAARLAEYLGSTHQSALSIGLLASEPLSSKAAFYTGAFYTASETRESTALNTIQLLEPGEVVLACLRLRAVLVALEHDALARSWSTSEWANRQAALDPWVDELVAVSLKSLGRPLLDRKEIWARAAADVAAKESAPATPADLRHPLPAALAEAGPA